MLKSGTREWTKRETTVMYVHNFLQLAAERYEHKWVGTPGFLTVHYWCNLRVCEGIAWRCWTLCDHGHAILVRGINLMHPMPVDGCLSSEYVILNSDYNVISLANLQNILFTDISIMEKYLTSCVEQVTSSNGKKIRMIYFQTKIGETQGLSALRITVFYSSCFHRNFS